MHTEEMPDSLSMSMEDIKCRAKGWNVEQVGQFSWPTLQHVPRPVDTLG